MGRLAGRDARLVHRRADAGRADRLRPVDGPDRPDATPWVHPVTQGLLGMRAYQLVSTDGGWTWPERRRIDLVAAPGRSSTGPVLGSPTASLAQPFEHWKERDDPEPGPAGGVAAAVDATAARPGRRRRSSRTIPTTRIYYWDQRLETPSRRRPPRQHVLDPRRRRRPCDIDVHIAWGSPDGRTWTVPIGTGLPRPALPADLARGRSAAGRLLAPWRPAGDPRGAERGLRAHLGSRHRDRRLGQRRGRRTGRRPAARRRTSTGTTWAPGSSGIRAAPCCRTARCSSCSTAAAASTRSARWARLRV